VTDHGALGAGLGAPSSPCSGGVPPFCDQAFPFAGWVLRSSGFFHSQLALAFALTLGVCYLRAETPRGTSPTPPTSPTPSSSSHRKGEKVSLRRNTRHTANARHRSSRYHGRRRASRRHGQQTIDAQRAREIQEALIREHYMDGEPSGKWDKATEDAMEHYQSDNGWQTKTIPDARALIKLGLGPDHEHLLNPETAMTGQPLPGDGASSAASKPAAAGPAAAGVPAANTPAVVAPATTSKAPASNATPAAGKDPQQ
jgi:Putative peptidoglycan binding domain